MYGTASAGTNPSLRWTACRTSSNGPGTCTYSSRISLSSSVTGGASTLLRVNLHLPAPGGPHPLQDPVMSAGVPNCAGYVRQDEREEDVGARYVRAIEECIAARVCRLQGWEHNRVKVFDAPLAEVRCHITRQ